MSTAAPAMPAFLPLDLTGTPGLFTPGASLDDSFDLFDQAFAENGMSSATLSHLPLAPTTPHDPTLPTLSHLGRIADPRPRSWLHPASRVPWPAMPSGGPPSPAPAAAPVNVKTASSRSSSAQPYSIAPAATWNAFAPEAYADTDEKSSPASWASPILSHVSPATPSSLGHARARPAPIRHGRLTPPPGLEGDDGSADEASEPTSAAPTSSATHRPETHPSIMSTSIGPGMKRPRGRPAGKRSNTSRPDAPKRGRNGAEPAVAFATSSLGAPAPEPADDERKRHKFLERNRVAASKCRQKKKQWTNNLEAHARMLQTNRIRLSAMASSLKEEVLWLKGEMLKHTTCDCARIRQYLDQEVDNLVPCHGGRHQCSAGEGTICLRISAASSGMAGASPMSSAALSEARMSRPTTASTPSEHSRTISTNSLGAGDELDLFSTLSDDREDLLIDCGDVNPYSFDR
ncbi:MAG: hypothetical protein M1826_004693 [Phylliscum demangeonii]|nr:MAG: hypothetical protein M1826_004693 [Phylliscum demangeonii]